MRLSLGPAWLFLIAAEAIAATEGLGYRIFLVRRFLAMDVILPYVAWITLLAFSLTDSLLRRLSRRLFPWAEPCMSRVQVRQFLEELSATAAVLERINLDVASGSFVTMVGAIRLRQEHLPAHASRAGAADPRRDPVDGAPLPAEPGPDRGIVFQRYSVFPHLTVLGTSCWAWS